MRNLLKISRRNQTLAREIVAVLVWEVAVWGFRRASRADLAKTHCYIRGLAKTMCYFPQRASRAGLIDFSGVRVAVPILAPILPIDFAI